MILYAQEGQWGLLAAQAAGAVGKAIWYYREKPEWFNNALKEKGPLPTPTFIVDIAMNAFAIWDCFNGIGAPDRGESFYLGKVEFENLHSYLKLAAPDERDWQGDAADAYAAQNQKLMDCATRMQELDLDMEQLAKEHGDIAKRTHDHFLAILTSLVGAQGVALLLYCIPGVGPGLSTAWQIAYVAGMLAWATTEVTELVKSSREKASQIDALGTEYDAVAQQVEEVLMSGTFDTVVFEKPDATQSQLSTFQAVADTLSGGPTLSSMPTITEVLEMAGPAGAERRDILSKLTASGAISEGATAGATMAETPASPMFRPPTPGHVGQSSPRAATIPEHAPQRMNLVNQAIGSAQQRTSLAQRQETAAPAEDAGPRAPIHAIPRGAEPAQQPSPARRIA